MSQALERKGVAREISVPYRIADGANSGMGIIRFQTDNDVVPLRVVSGKRAIAEVEAVRRSQRLQIMARGGRPREGRLQIGIGIASPFWNPRTISGLTADIPALPVRPRRGETVGEAAAKDRKIRKISGARRGHRPEHH